VSCEHVLLWLTGDDVFERRDEPPGATVPAHKADRVAVMCITYHNLGVECEHLRRWTECMQAYSQGVELATVYLGDEHGITQTLKTSQMAAHKSITKERSGRAGRAKPTAASSVGKSRSKPSNRPGAPAVGHRGGDKPLEEFVEEFAPSFEDTTSGQRYREYQQAVKESRRAMQRSGQLYEDDLTEEEKLLSAKEEAEERERAYAHDGSERPATAGVPGVGSRFLPAGARATGEVKPMASRGRGEVSWDDKAAASPTDDDALLGEALANPPQRVAEASQEDEYTDEEDAIFQTSPDHPRPQESSRGEYEDDDEAIFRTSADHPEGEYEDEFEVAGALVVRSVEVGGLPKDVTKVSIELAMGSQASKALVLAEVNDLAVTDGASGVHCFPSVLGAAVANLGSGDSECLFVTVKTSGVSAECTGVVSLGDALLITGATPSERHALLTPLRIGARATVDMAFVPEASVEAAVAAVPARA
jgi:hypothetical protein